MVKIHAIASGAHLMRHILPIWNNLPEEMKGLQQVGRIRMLELPAEDPVLVAGYTDVQHCATYDRRCIYIEHGAGQSYVDASRQSRPYYSGGEHPDNVIGYVVPRVEVGERWHGRPYVVAGCPAIESILRVERQQKVAAITFHWEGSRVCPEARSARPHYAEALPAIAYRLRQHGYRVVGHWHPRDLTGWDVWRRANVERVADIDDVLAIADVLILDNSSVGYEAAALGIPTVWLNAPWYRRDVHHGLRFWDRVPGPQVDRPVELWRSDEDLFTQQPDPDLVDSVYGPGDSRIAADWIAELVS